MEAMSGAIDEGLQETPVGSAANQAIIWSPGGGYDEVTVTARRPPATPHACPRLLSEPKRAVGYGASRAASTYRTYRTYLVSSFVLSEGVGNINGSPQSSLLVWEMLLLLIRQRQQTHTTTHTKHLKYHTPHGTHCTVPTAHGQGWKPAHNKKGFSSPPGPSTRRGGGGGGALSRLARPSHAGSDSLNGDCKCVTEHLSVDDCQLLMSVDDCCQLMIDD